MKGTIRDLMAVDSRSHQSGRDADGGSIPAAAGEILVGSFTADHQQDLDDAQRQQSQPPVRLHPVVAESHGDIGHVVSEVIAPHASDEHCSDGVASRLGVGKLRFLLNVIRGNAHTAHVVAKNALT